MLPVFRLDMRQRHDDQAIRHYLSQEFSAMQCIPTTYILDVRIFSEEKWKGFQKAVEI